MSHIALTVRDLRVSERWYREVFALGKLEEIELPGLRMVVLVDPDTQISFNLHEHTAGLDDPFDERRIGLDHVSLLVDGPQILTEWAEHLDQLGVARSPIVVEDYGSVLVFRDPDNIQLELFANADHVP